LTWVGRGEESRPGVLQRREGRRGVGNMDQGLEP
jgi:hypothetical protein